MDNEYSNLEQNRLEKLERLRSQGHEPYPTRAERSHTSQQAISPSSRALRTPQRCATKALPSLHRLQL